MYIATVNSTNDYLRLHPDIVTLRTDFQTSGRGQAGNHWESEPGKNLLFSTRLKEIGLAATDQWFINMLVAVALYETLNTKLSTLNSTLTIKWPNDLYYGDKKLAGVLIENTLLGTRIADSIIGIGLNLNQTEWHSDAPNPISLKQITGEDYDPDDIMNMLLTTLAQLMPNMNRIRSDYMQHLYRREGFYWWEEREVSTMPTMNGTRTEQSFEAQIVDITSQGELVLQTHNQDIKTYNFKQIKYIL